MTTRLQINMTRKSYCVYQLCKDEYNWGKYLWDCKLFYKLRRLHSINEFVEYNG